MITKLPRWVWTGAWLLSFIGGSVNVLGFLGFNRQAITHLTGTTSSLAGAVASGETSAVLHYGASIAAFVLGCVVSGFLIQDSALQLRRPYGAALLLEAGLLLLSIPLLERGSHLGFYAAACACGLQNAMMSTYSGTVVRTTHVSGMFTDLGVFLGHALRGLPVDPRRFRLCLLVISGFFIGGVIGTWAFHYAGYRALFIPIGLTLALACGHAWYRRREPA